jgi:hypothetical protein
LGLEIKLKVGGYLLKTSFVDVNASWNAGYDAWDSIRSGKVVILPVADFELLLDLFRECLRLRHCKITKLPN